MSIAAAASTARSVWSPFDFVQQEEKKKKKTSRQCLRDELQFECETQFSPSVPLCCTQEGGETVLCVCVFHGGGSRSCVSGRPLRLPDR